MPIKLLIFVIFVILLAGFVQNRIIIVLVVRRNIIYIRILVFRFVLLDIIRLRKVNVKDVVGIVRVVLQLIEIIVKAVNSHNIYMKINVIIIVQKELL